MRLYITKQDFDEGVTCNDRLCPVGRAANREAARRGWDRASVGKTSVCFVAVKVACTRALHRELSAKVGCFIRDFDRGRLDRLAFKPFSFIVKDIPDLTAGNPG